MKYKFPELTEHRKQPVFKRSLIAAAVIGLSSQAMAQETQSPDPAAEESVEVINVRGIRTSLIKAQELKREADTFIDAITASDIGALPDRSVLEAMQRIPGISIERFAAANDPDHFGVEGSGAVIRGMTATRSEFNGRDSFTANSGRGLSFQDVPPELMGSVRVYKNQSADLIEGGIGGTVSLHTRLPFDFDEPVIAFSGDVTYSDLSETTKPTFSAMFSDNWETDVGKFGLLINGSNSKLESRSDMLQSEVFLERENLVEGQTVLAPNGGNFGQKNDARERTGLALAAQWESLDKRSLVSAQFLRSDATLAWTENTVAYQTNFYEDDGVSIRRDSFPLDGVPGYEFDDSGSFVSGTITDTPAGGWRSNGNDQQRVPIAADWGNPSIPQFGNRFQTTARSKDQRTVVEDYALNYKFRPNDTWSHEFDLQYIKAETSDLDVTLFFGTHANQTLDLSGDVPSIALLNPWNGQESGNGFENNENYFQTDSSYFWRSAMDHIEQSDGDSKAFRYDTKYTFDDGLFSAVKVGVRYAQREQTVRFSQYNWQALGAIFGPDLDQDGYAGAWLDLPVAAGLADAVDQVSWDNHHRGGTISIPGMGYTLHPSMELVQNYQTWSTRLAPVSGDWEALDQRQIQNGVDAQGNPTFEQLQGPFRPAEINNLVETNKAFYVRGDFVYDDWKFPISGNIGVRYVELTRETDGFVIFPDLIPNDPNSTTEAINFLPEDDRAFGDFGTAQLDDVYKDDYVLPSFNVKVDLDDDLLLRFAVAKAIAFPDTGLLKNYVSLSADVATERGEPNDEGQAPILDANATYRGSSGNPFLEPMESVQYDLALEWYFSESSSLTGTVFYKDLSNFFVTGAEDVEFTNNGVTKTARVQRSLNQGDGTMQGLELSYTHLFDFLPAPFDALGIQANYTYIDAKGVPNSNLDASSVDGRPATNTNNTDIAFDTLPLEGQSKHTANLVLTYENDMVSGRIAYNWRSDYLLTARDVIQPHYPIWNEAAGFMDASVFYNLTDNVKIGLQGVNLLDTVTKTSMQLDEQGTRVGRSWFINDRRLSFVVRASF